MLPRRIEVFFYGLFMDADLLRTKGAEPVKIRPACVPGFALRIGQRATLLRNPDARAYGILMELTHDEIEQLYSEASVRAYRPEAVLCELGDGSRVPALCFNLVVPPGPEEANSEYAAKLRGLVRRLGSPLITSSVSNKTTEKDWTGIRPAPSLLYTRIGKERPTSMHTPSRLIFKGSPALLAACWNVQRRSENGAWFQNLGALAGNTFSTTWFGVAESLADEGTTSR